MWARRIWNASPINDKLRSRISRLGMKTMLTKPSEKYPAYAPLVPKNRSWPSSVIKKAPIWLSTDLRDGNQALINPMTVEQKIMFFRQLVRCGFKEIEVAFPAASETEFRFVRQLIQSGEVPQDVWLQVLTPARADLIKRTIDAVAGAKCAIINLYNAISPTFRELVFHKSMKEIIDLAVSHTRLVRTLTQECTAREGTRFKFIYSPETFTQAEPEFAVRVCQAVMDEWAKAGPGDDRIIFNLPATVEIGPPNHYADQVEFFCNNIRDRHHMIVSLHAHNDRGTAVAATEMGLLAGADRVEGCLFGNGERTGNVDLVNLALNLYTQGVPPNLDFSDIQSVVDTVTECNGLPIHPRHPYVGELVFTAFSGSHQDAIKKGFQERSSTDDNGTRSAWRMPYLPLDPTDIGRNYEAIIRVNSQSGKAGAAYLIKQALNLDLPRRMQMSFYQIIQELADHEGREITVDEISEVFQRTYFYGRHSMMGRLALHSLGSHSSSTVLPESNAALCGPSRRQFRIEATIIIDGSLREIRGSGGAPLSAFLDALQTELGIQFSICEHTQRVSENDTPLSVNYVQLALRTSDDRVRPGRQWGVGVSADPTESVALATLSAVNGLLRGGLRVGPLRPVFDILPSHKPVPVPCSPSF